MMKWMRYVVYGALVLCLLFAVAGCGWVDQFRSYKDAPQEGGGAAGEENSGEQGASIVEQRLGLVGEEQSEAVSGDKDSAETATPEGSPTGSDEQQAAEPGTNDSQDGASTETKEVMLYFVSADSNALEPELRNIPKEEGLARATVKQLLSGPREEDLLPAIPSGVSLRDIDVSSGLCTVDLSADLSELASISQTQQVLALYSLVNTLTQFDTVDYVQVLVNGQQLMNFGGVDASQALAPLDI